MATTNAASYENFIKKFRYNEVGLPDDSSP